MNTPKQLPLPTPKKRKTIMSELMNANRYQNTISSHSIESQMRDNKTNFSHSIPSPDNAVDVAEASRKAASASTQPR